MLFEIRVGEIIGEYPYGLETMLMHQEENFLPCEGGPEEGFEGIPAISICTALPSNAASAIQISTSDFTNDIQIQNKT